MNNPYIKEHEQLSYFHARCWAEKSSKDKEESLAKLMQPASLEILNASFLLIQADMDLSEDTNVNAAAIRAERYYVNMPWERKLMSVRVHESIVATLSRMLKQERRNITEELKKLDAERISKAREEQKAQSAARKVIATPKTDAKRLSRHERGVAEFMKLGIPKETAEAMMFEAEAKRDGREPPVQ